MCLQRTNVINTVSVYYLVKRMQCEYGCGNEANHVYKNGKRCCSSNIAKCPTFRTKFSEENKARNKAGCIVSGFIQPKKQCHNCLKLVSAGNLPKHVKWCEGKGADCHTCKICNSEFRSRSRDPKTCSAVCFSVYQSQKTSMMYSTGVKSPYGGAGAKKIYHSKLHGAIKVMSSYEYDACGIFDQWYESQKIKFWEYTKDKFSYLDETGKLRTYFPDFKVFNLDGTSFYVETKGFQTERDLHKWQAVRDQGHELRVWFGEHIMNYKDNKD